MKLSRHATAAVLALAVSLGTGASAAVAAPHAGHGKHAHADARHVAHVKEKGAHGRSDQAKAGHGKSGEQLTRAQRKLTREAARKDRFLARLLDRHKLTRLDDTVEAGVRANIQGDRDELAALVSQLGAGADVALADLAGQVHAYRPEVYNTILNQLRLVTRLQSTVGDAGQAPADGTTDGGAGTAPADASADLTGLVTTLGGYDATTSRADLRATKRELSQVVQALEGTEDADGAEQAGDAGSTTETDGTTDGSATGDGTTP